MVRELIRCLNARQECITFMYIYITANSQIALFLDLNRILPYQSVALIVIIPFHY